MAVRQLARTVQVVARNAALSISRSFLLSQVDGHEDPEQNVFKTSLKFRPANDP